MGSEVRNTNRMKWGGALSAGLLLVALIAIGAWLANRDGTPAPPIAFTPVSNVAISTPPAATPSPGATPSMMPTRELRPPTTPIPHGDATPVGSPGATPASPAVRGVPDDACEEGCLIRIERTDGAMAVLDDAGLRSSYESDEWVWTVVSRETAGAIAATGAGVFLVHDSAETLYLYATRLPEGVTSNAAVEAFGAVLDVVDGHSIVLVESVPPVVTGIVEERIWIEKVRPATVTEREIAVAGEGDSLTDVELGALIPEVSPQNLLATVTELQATSSTDGTGIGTRHYTRPGNVMAAEYLFARLEAYGLQVWYEDFITWDGYLVSNVLGEIPGRDDSMISTLR